MDGCNTQNKIQCDDRVYILKYRAVGGLLHAM